MSKFVATANKIEKTSNAIVPGPDLEAMTRSESGMEVPSYGAAPSPSLSFSGGGVVLSEAEDDGGTAKREAAKAATKVKYSTRAVNACAVATGLVLAGLALLGWVCFVGPHWKPRQGPAGSR